MLLRHQIRALPPLLLLLLANPAQAQTADELIARNLAARGGAPALAALKSVRFEGRTIFPGGFELAYKEVRARSPRGDTARLEASLQGLAFTQAWDGEIAWRINPFEGRRDAERVSADEARQLADSALIDGPLLNAKARGSRVEALGREDFDGTSAHKLKVIESDGDEFVYLLDPDTFLEIKVTETRRLRGAPQVFETEMGDYEAAGGVMFPMSVESWQPGQAERQRTQIAKAEVNVEAPPALFAQPASPATPAAR